MEGRQDHWANPVVTVPNPRRGWRAASRSRRACALAAVPVVGLWTLGLAAPLPLWATSEGNLGWAAAAVYAVVGPTVCYAAARVVRPHHGPDADRVLRHPLAAAGTAYGLPLLLAEPAINAPGWPADFAASSDAAGVLSGAGLDSLVFVVVLFGLGAGAAGLLTTTWGLVAVLVRAVGLSSTAATRRRRRQVDGSG